MDAVVLAGGYATRLWPITRHRPKVLLPVGDSTVLDRILPTLEDDERIDSVYVSTNEAFAERIQTHVATAGYDSVRVSVEASREEAEKFGVVGALAQLREREDLVDDLLVVAGDNLVGFDLGDLLDYYDARDAPVIAAYDVESRERARSYGLVELDGERVVDFQEKPDDPKSTLVAIACYAFPADSVRFEEYLTGGNNPDEPGWYIQWLQSQEPVYAYTFDGAWFDIGTPDSYLQAVDWALDGESLVHPDAAVENADIGDTVHVMEDAEVTDSTLERTVVFPNATVHNCNLERTILGEHVHVENLDVADALITEMSSPGGRT